jgi:hypothetical protein
MSETYYVKSCEEDFYTKTLKGKQKVNFQSIENMVKKKIIKPNTKSFGRKMRLSTTVLSRNYFKTYRPQGIIFQTTDNPNYVLPCDLVLLTKADKIVVHYYRIKKNLHTYYTHELMKGFKKFIFKDFKSMVQILPSPRKVWIEVNKFRKSAGYSILPIEKYRLVEYNEAVFLKPVKINPVAIFGYRKEARMLAKKLNLPHFISVKEFWKRSQNE